MNKNEYTSFLDLVWKQESIELINKSKELIWPNNYLTWEPTNQDFWKVHFKIKKFLTYDL